ncbi:MAG TPA: cation-transporting P-type ATPase [Gallionella sp.]|nr:cation-transporting P-type ATPase [Gallionella sp.]
MTPHQRDIQRLYARLHSGADGLTQAEARRRLARYGPNRIEKIAEQPLAGKLLKEFTHFFAMILWLAAGLAFFAEWREPGQGMATLGYAILGVILVNGLFSFWQEYRAEQALAALRNLLPQHTTALRDGKAVPVPVAELVPGDVVLLAAGDNVPADCRLLEASGVRVNTATLTGESSAKARDVGAPTEAKAALRRDVLHAGTSLISGEAKAMVYATGMRTEFGNIARLTQTLHEPLSPLQKEIKRLSWLVGLFSLLLGAFFFAVGHWIGLSFWVDLMFAIGVIVANVPEGLLPTVTLSLAMATQRMAKKNALVRHLSAVETLGEANVICSDKTGTLTQNRMSIRQIFYSGELFAFEPTEETKPISRRRAAAMAREAEPLLAIMRHCHDLRRVEKDGKTVWQGDPMEIAIMQGAPAEPTYPRLEEIPFDTERKRMSVICDTPKGRMLYCKGAPETVVPLCTAILEQGSTMPIDDDGRASLRAMEVQMAEQGLRVIALAYRCLTHRGAHSEEDLVFAGLIGLMDPPREGVAEAIATCQAAGVRVIMITGDHPRTAGALAREIGLSQQPLAVTGDTLHNLTETDLQLLLDEPELLFARTSAEQKMRIVQALQRKGMVVAVTGDGVNDAPALRCADIGIAMGIAGTDVAKEASDIVLLDDNFATIVTAIEEGRAVYDNLRKFLTYILTHNVAELVPYLAFVMFKVPLPLTVIQILAIDLGTDTLPALALGAEKPDPAVMQRPPRPAGERMFSGGMLARVYLFLGPLEAVAVMSAFFFVLYGGGWQFGATLGAHDQLYLQATTACLAAIVTMQVVNIFLCRHPTRSVFSRVPRNDLIAWGIVFELALLLLIVYTPWGNAIFATAPLAAEVWLFLIPFGLGLLLLEEGRKAVMRGMARRNAAESIPR